MSIYFYYSLSCRIPEQVGDKLNPASSDIAIYWFPAFAGTTPGFRVKPGMTTRLIHLPEADFYPAAAGRTDRTMAPRVALRLHENDKVHLITSPPGIRRAAAPSMFI